MTNLKRAADYVVQESYEAETQDHEDHTFCGVMFDLQTKTALPLEFIEISSVWVRGSLGPIGVYWTEKGYKDKSENSKDWHQVYQKTHRASRFELVELILDTPIRLIPGSSIGLYVHSTSPGDQAIVYDNQRGDVTHDDVMIRVTPGMAHISNTPFSKNGMWGWGWRPNREFVGKVSYGVRYKLWNPNKMTASQFPKCFQNTAVTLLMCHNRKECALYRLPHAVILFVLNMMPWNWNGELSDEEKPQTKAKPQYSEHEGRSYYHRIHRMNHQNDEDEDDVDDDDDDDYVEESDEDEEWIAQQEEDGEEEDDDNEYVQFGGVALPRSIMESELFQERPEIAAWLVQQILEQQAETSEASAQLFGQEEEGDEEVLPTSSSGVSVSGSGGSSSSGSGTSSSSMQTASSGRMQWMLDTSDTAGGSSGSGSGVAGQDTATALSDDQMMANIQNSRSATQSGASIEVMEEEEDTDVTMKSSK